ncbi:hypothetical protein FQR65_LT17989 [Abscondita terminalis]|nr:hypothetical protein FQR65_LT17989 [Abscondita terminalis]
MRKKTAKILIVDDDEDILFSAKVWLKKFFTDVKTLNNPKKIIPALTEDVFDVILLDMNFRKGFENGQDGLYWMNEVKEVSPDIPIILMTAYGEVELAVEALKLGASDLINTVEITIPPLRERLEDMPLFAQYFLAKYQYKYHKTLSLSEEDIKELCSYNWPGNIRELEHAMERSVILSDHRILQLSLPKPMENISEGLSDVLNIEEMEEILIKKALKKHQEWKNSESDENKILYYQIRYFLLVLSWILAFDAMNQENGLRLAFPLPSFFMIIPEHRMPSNPEKNRADSCRAIHHKDFSFVSGQETKNDPLKQKAVDLLSGKREKYRCMSFKILYENILNQLDIGIMILKENTNDWEVFYSNPKFIEILKVPKYNKWSLYEEKIPIFFKLIKATNYRESQDFMEVSINQSGFQTYSLRTTRLETPREDFCIISLESVQKIIERKEKMAWNNLMKVISHELMNTLTQSNSLIRNMEYITDQEEISGDDQEEIKESLKIVNNKSQQLLSYK